MQMTAELTIVVGIVCTIIGSVLGILGYKRNIQKDATAAGKREGGLMIEIGYIRSGIDDIKREQRAQAERHNALSERVIRNEERTDHALHRIDGLESKCFRVAEKRN